jgi:hypothetical protein
VRSTCPAHLILLDLIIPNARRRVQIMKLLIMQFSPTSFHVILLHAKYSPQHSVLKHHEYIFSLNITDQVSHPYRTTGKIILSAKVTYKSKNLKVLESEDGISAKMKSITLFCILSHFDLIYILGTE